MFNITKLSAVALAFVGEMNSSNQSRSNETSLAVAKVLTNCVVLPSSEVTDIELFYRTHVQMDLENKLNAINELIVLDTKTVLDYSLQLYKLRYQAANPSCYVCAFNKETAIEDFFGISKVMSINTLATVKNSPAVLAVYINKFNSLVNDLFATQTQDNASTMGGVAV